MSLESCLVHIDNNDGVLDRRTKRKIFDEVMAMSRKDASLTEEQLMKKIKEQIADGIDKSSKNVFNALLIKKKKELMLVHRVTGKPLTTLKQVLEQELDSLVGRDSLDTQVRNLRNRLVNDYDSMEMRFRTHENAKFKSLRNIEEGSAEEAYVFKKVAAFTEELSPEKLTKEKIDALLKAHPNELDRIALSMVAYNGHARQFANSYGMSVKFNKNYVMKRRYDMGAINKMFGEDAAKARIQFADYMLTKLNLAETFGEKTTEAQAKAHLVNLYDELKKSAGARTSVLNPKEFNSDRANSIARALVYKDPNAAYDAFRDLSVGGLRDQFDRNARSLASNVVRIDNYGYDQKEVLKELFDFQEARFGKERSSAEHALEDKIKMARAEVLGDRNYVQTGLTDFTNAAKFGISSIKLHKAILSAMMDVMETNRQVFFNEGEWFGGIGQWLNTFRQLATPEWLGGMSIDEKQAMANDLGIVFNYFSSGESMRMAQGDLVTTGNKITSWLQSNGSTIMNWTSLLPWQTGVSKLSSANVGASRFLSMVDKFNGGQYNKRQLKFVNDTLAIYKITPAEMKLLGQVDRVNTWGSPIITSKSIRDSFEKLGAENIAKELGVDRSKAADAWISLAEKFESYQNDFNVRGTPTPELATKVLIPGRMSESERVRVISSLASQFMDTPIAQAQNFFEMIEKTKRINMNEDGKLNKLGITQDLAPYLMLYGVMASSAYLAFDAAYSTIFNQQSLMDQFINGDEEARSKVMWKVIDRASPVPFVFNMLESQMSDRYNETAADTFNGGPVLGALKDTLNLVKPTGNGWEKDLGKFVKRQGPQRVMPIKFINNWVSDEKL